MGIKRSLRAGTLTTIITTAAMLFTGPTGIWAQKVEYTSADLFWRRDEFLNVKKARGAIAVWGVGYGLTLGLLGTAWYAGQPWGGFRFFDDFHQWKQMDKFGHAYAGYHFSRAAMETAKWAGASRRQVFWVSSVGFWMLLPIEIFDGFMPKYGAAWGDLAANAAGSALAWVNEYAWGTQRIGFKVGYSPTDYPRLRPDALGKTFAERLLKDYNGHTFWFSCSPHYFWRRWPAWMCISVGYGAGGLLGGYGKEDPAVIAAREYRRYHLSLDVDFTRIPTRKPGLKLLFGMLNTLKFPFPSVELSRMGIGFRPLHF
jgi:hypothetical protein